MTRATNARIAGFTFLAYIAAGLGSMVCRVVEGVLAGLSISGTLAVFWLATASGAEAPDVSATKALAAYLLRDDVALTATFFAVGSTAFSWLLLRGRLIPISLSWLGVVASAVLVVGLPLQLAGWVRGPITSLVWLPMLAFEVPLGFWLRRGGSPPIRTRAPQSPPFERVGRMHLVSPTFGYPSRDCRF
jgi:hypothetical protein